jgi:two-component system response regulator FixJ
MNDAVVTIVDDDAAFLESIAVLISSLGFRCEQRKSADDFLAHFDPQQPGCLILDVRMPGVSGLVLQERLMKEPLCPPIIVMTAFAEVPIALRAMRQGAVEFLQKTGGETELLEAIQRAIAQDTENRARLARVKKIEEAFSKLSPAELDVLGLVIAGKANKNIASALDIGLRTVEDRRARIMEKLGVDTVPEMVRLAQEAGIKPTE